MRDMHHVKSKERVANHGEVFTPRWLVDDMLNLVRVESERLDSRFLEPACGSGNFLVPILERKLNSVRSIYGKSEFETRHHALYALMNVYGIEILADNIQECRANLLEVFRNFLDISSTNVWANAGHVVVSLNIVHGDALTMLNPSGDPLVFPEWGYLGKGLYQRRDFLLANLAQRSSYRDTLFASLDEQELFVPIETYPKLSVRRIAELRSDQ